MHNANRGGARRCRLLASALAIIPAVCLAAALARVAHAANPANNSTETLSFEQEQIADKFRRFEEVVLRMAEMTAETDPDRAALLRKVISQGKERLVGMQFERVIELIGGGRLAVATENQKELEQDLKSLLQLLLSEDRAKRLESEQARIRAALKEINQLIRQQRALRAETDRSQSPDRLADRQGGLAERAGELAKDMKQHEGDGDDAEAGGEPSDDEGEPGQSDASGEPADEQGGKSGEGEGSPSDESQPGEGESQDGQPQDGQPSEGQPQDGQPQEGQAGDPSQDQGQPSQSMSPQVPARERLESAQQRMQRAEERLRDAERDGALDEQEAALRELEQAKAHLEEVLRQLREEEMQRMLAMLEARFRKMLKMQIEVYEGTRVLDAIPADRRDRSTEVQAGRLSRQESLIVVEADKALVLLREDGSAVALPEAVAQAREDMQQVVTLLGRTEIGELTQAIQRDIITALEEIIEAVKQAQQELEEQSDQPPGEPGEPQDPALIDQLAELKMIRALQMRVNQRTERYRQLIDGEQAEDPQLLDALTELARREERIFRATRDIVVGRNQ